MFQLVTAIQKVGKQNVPVHKKEQNYSYHSMS